MFQAYLLGNRHSREKSVEHSFCAKQCVMLMEKIALKERCWLFVAINYC